jgi:hypothetical protein
VIEIKVEIMTETTKVRGREQEWMKKWSRSKENHHELANMKQTKNKCKQHQNKKKTKMWQLK